MVDKEEEEAKTFVSILCSWSVEHISFPAGEGLTRRPCFMAAAAAASGRVLLLFMYFAALLRLSSGDTDPQDAAALRALLQFWTGGPSNWGTSNDPCGMSWDGVTCTNSRVTSLKLPAMGIMGSLSGDIGNLTALQILILSNNTGLSGSLPGNIGNLKQLVHLDLGFCSFSGKIPQELGNLTNLSYLALLSNQFSGEIPASLGFLSNLTYLDLTDNHLTGSLPISIGSTPGLDLLTNTQHFHFSNNQLSGQIPEKLFSAEMKLIHILFANNSFNGTIPGSIGLLEDLEILLLRNNKLSGNIPQNISNLSNLTSLDLSYNQLTGQIQTVLFTLPQLVQMILANNSIDGNLVMGYSPSPDLQLVNVQNNNISVIQTGNYQNTLLAAGNPACDSNQNAYCRQLQQHPQLPYTTSLANCGSASCAAPYVNPGSCACACPLVGEMFFEIPQYLDISNSTLFHQLENTSCTMLGLTPGSVYISDVYLINNETLHLQLALFPSSGSNFNQTEFIRIVSLLNSRINITPKEFGPYYFFLPPYYQCGRKSGLSAGTTAGIAVGCSLLAIALIGVGIYALHHQREAKSTIQRSQPFASWRVGDPDAGSAPQLKGARWFSFDELRKCTNNFSEDNALGIGGYGMVYRGLLPSGQIVAVKRAKQGSRPGAEEFKMEIELLSRLHHKNIVELVGFCYEEEEQMLVYEFIPNGTLRENLSGKGGRQLDWRRRLKIALDSARGLAYLHELANPPIIHRDVKTSNILLDENLTAKVADFGLSKLALDSQKSHVSTQVKGTLGYLDPEYYMTQQLSEKSDVYSFGVVMLELISGKFPIEKGKYIVREVRKAIDKDDEVYYGLQDLMDLVLLNSSSILVGLRRFVELAMQCVEDSAASRPNMSEVVKEIEMILHSQGLKTSSSVSSASSAKEFGSTKVAPPLPYLELMPIKFDRSGAFEYSGWHSFGKNIEPK